MIATLSLSPAIDKVVSVQGLSLGRHLRVKKLKEVAAGKGINCARIIKRLGGDVIVIGVAGGPNGEWIKKELNKEKIKFDFIPIKGNIRQNLTILDEGKGREIHLREECPPISRGEIELIKNRLREWAPKLRFLIISGRLPQGVPVNFYKEIISFSKKRNIPVLLDANGPGFKNGVGACPDYLKPNLTELEELAEKRLRRRSEQIKFIKAFINRGLNMVVVTQGSGEVLALSSIMGLVLTPPRIRARNTVGSGDAVSGALAYGLTRGLELKQLLKLSVACGSAHTFSIGSGFLDMRLANSLSKKINVKVLYNYSH